MYNTPYICKWLADVTITYECIVILLPHRVSTCFTRFVARVMWSSSNRSRNTWRTGNCIATCGRRSQSITNIAFEGKCLTRSAFWSKLTNVLKRLVVFSWWYFFIYDIYGSRLQKQSRSNDSCIGSIEAFHYIFSDLYLIKTNSNKWQNRPIAWHVRRQVK